MVQRIVALEGEGIQDQHSLSILCGSQQIGFYTRQKNDDRLHSFELYEWKGQPDYLDCIQEATAQSSLYQQPYRETEIIWQDAAALLLPGSMPAAEAGEVAATMLSLQQSGIEKSTVMDPYQLWWHCPGAMHTAVEHLLTPDLHRHLFGLFPVRQETGIYLHISGSLLSIAAYIPELVWIQQYPFETPEDVLYHILNARQLFHLSAAETPVWMNGFFVPDSSLVSCLRQYLPHLHFQESYLSGEGYPSHSFTLFQPSPI